MVIFPLYMIIVLDIGGGGAKKAKIMRSAKLPMFTVLTHIYFDWKYFTGL